ncbi:MAG TPA: PHB depolymerase family esterase, partial [Polyangiaceae bacterium]|nr:PHB depolymerase family esterase [Polyangiaceae bacterium]
PDAGVTDSSDAEPPLDAAQDLPEDSPPDQSADAPFDEADAAEPLPSLERRTYAGLEGKRDYLLHRPAGPQDKPLVVVLHGCNQSAASFAKLTGFDLLAEEASFVAVFPEQSGQANPYLCWNWFLEDQQRRDVGEAAILHGIVGEVVAEGGIDPSRIYAIGLSAGGAMAVVLGTVFADVFAAVGTVEGCPFRGTPCLNEPSPLTGNELAQIAYSAMGAHARALPVFVVQGDADAVVKPANGDLVVEQWLGVADLADNGQLDGSVPRTPTTEQTQTAPGGKTYEILTYGEGESVWVLRWTVMGMAHAWSGGASGMLFSDPEGPDAARGAWDFFSKHVLP